MTKRCVVCGEKVQFSRRACDRCEKRWLRSKEPDLTVWVARQVRANERRKYRELLRAAETVCWEASPGRIPSYNAVAQLETAVRNAKARRSR